MLLPMKRSSLPSGRGLAVGDDLRMALAQATDPAALGTAISQVATAASPAEVLAALRT